MKISVDVVNLVTVAKTPVHAIRVSEADYRRICEAYGVYPGRYGMVVGEVEFKSEPSITEELDKLLAQRVQTSLEDRIVMSREVFARYLEEMGNVTSARYPYRESDYKGVIIRTEDEVEGGVQLKCDYYIKGSL